MNSPAATNSTAGQRLREAIANHRAGDYKSAERGYREHLRDFPTDASGLHFLGLLRTHQDRNDEAIKLITAALESDPDYVDAWSNLGVAYYRERDFDRAEFCARKAIEIAPDFANAWANLGMTLRSRNALEEALVAWGHALDLQPAMRNIAISYGHLLYRLNRLPEALEFYARWQASVPDDPIPQHMRAALGGSQAPSRASDGYVRATFDDFAESFDRNLEELGYRAPQLLFDTVSGIAAPPRHKLDVLDIGCGTGLCGALLRPLSHRLVGVDLSPNMLSKAAARAVYDQLNCAELTHWLASCGQQFELAVAADVLCYFGDLYDAFDQVRTVLTPGGTFACSLEVLPESAAPASPDPIALQPAGSAPASPVPTAHSATGPASPTSIAPGPTAPPPPGLAPVSSAPFVLQPHGRYQHSRHYVESMLKAVGLQVVSLSTATLRYERQEPVTGLLVVARRPVAPGD